MKPNTIKYESLISVITEFEEEFTIEDVSSSISYEIKIGGETTCFKPLKLKSEVKQESLKQFIIKALEDRDKDLREEIIDDIYKSEIANWETEDINLITKTIRGK